MSNSNENIFDELKNKISGEIYTDKIRRYMHSTDGSIFRVEPACIVYPKNRQDVVEIVKFANNYQLSIHSRGAGSGLCGAAIGRGIVIDFRVALSRSASCGLPCFPDDRRNSSVVFPRRLYRLGGLHGIMARVDQTPPRESTRTASRLARPSFSGALFPCGAGNDTGDEPDRLAEAKHERTNRRDAGELGGFP